MIPPLNRTPRNRISAETLSCGDMVEIGGVDEVGVVEEIRINGYGRYSVVAQVPKKEMQVTVDADRCRRLYLA